MRVSPIALLVVAGLLPACVGELESSDGSTGATVAIDPDVDVLGFGGLEAGRSVERTVAVTNRGGATLYVEQVTVEGAAGFWVDTTDLSRRLPPGSDTSFTVGFSPDRDGHTDAELVIQTTDVLEPEVRLVLTGDGYAPRIELVPTVSDLQATAVGCSAEHEVEVRNAGTLPLELVDFSLEATSDELILGDLPGPGTILEPGDSITVSVLYEPVDTVQDTAALEVVSNDPLGPVARAMLTADAPLGEAWTDAFVQQQPREVDILWVVDDSSSMYDEQSALAYNAHAFLTALDGIEDLDWRVGVVTTGIAELQGSVPVMDASLPGVIDAFADTVAVGTAGSGTEQGLARAYEALTPPLTSPGGANHGFQRQAATLHVIVVSDEEDDSPDTVSAYVLGLQSLVDSPDRVALSCVTGGANGCSGAGGSAYVSTRYEEAAVLSGGLKVSICDPTWAAEFDDMVWNADLPNDTFELEFDPVAGSIEVELDGASLPLGWSYDPELNAVVFESHTVPADGADVAISYALFGDCEE